MTVDKIDGRDKSISATIFHDGRPEKCWDVPPELESSIVNILRRAGKVTDLANGIYKVTNGTYLIFEE